MTIEISNIRTVKKGTRTEIKRVSYLASSIEDCRDGIDAMAYELALEHGDVIKIGQVIATPA